MSRRIHLLNFVGVVALAALCAYQWQSNRALNLEAGRLEKIRQDQAARIVEHEKTIEGRSADLDEFRTQLERTHTSLKDAERKVAIQEERLGQLAGENETLKTGIAGWAAAVKVRDERLHEANERIVATAARADEAVQKFNQLATDYNEVVRQLNEARTPSPAPPQP